MSLRVNCLFFAPPRLCCPLDKVLENLSSRRTAMSTYLKPLPGCVQMFWGRPRKGQRLAHSVQPHPGDRASAYLFPWPRRSKMPVTNQWASIILLCIVASGCVHWLGSPWMSWQAAHPRPRISSPERFGYRGKPAKRLAGLSAAKGRGRC